jgi:hypothetical protein
MFWDQITKTWMQLVSKSAAVRDSALQDDFERDVSPRSKSPQDAVYEEAGTEPYTPPSTARLSEDSLHLSC